MSKPKCVDDCLEKGHLQAPTASTTSEETAGSRISHETTHELHVLRDGQPTNLYSREYAGLLAQYAAIGFIGSTLANTIYPFLANYLNLDGTVTSTAQVLVDMPNSFKVFYGLLSDMVPIHGYRRRPYMLIGWSVCLFVLLIMGISQEGRPYFLNPELRHIKPDQYTRAQLAQINPKALDHGAKYVLLMMAASCGYLMAAVCADGVLVEVAQREPDDVRGKSQTVIYMVQVVFSIVGQVIVALALNGHEYGGQFDFSLSFSVFMLLLAVCLSPILPLTWWFLHEDPVAPVDRRAYLDNFWKFIQSRAVYQVIGYKFLAGIFENWSWIAVFPVQQYWVGVSPFNDKVSALLGSFVFMGALKVTETYGLHWNWRLMGIVTMLFGVGLDAICTMCTVWNVVRSQWFWLGLPVVQSMPAGISFIVSTFVTVELAGEGNEGASYGLLTTVTNLASPLAAMLTKYSNRPFDITTERIQNDSVSIRVDVTITILLSYAMKIFSLYWLFLLPSQKNETQILKVKGGSSRFMGTLTICYLSVALLYSMTTNILGIFKSTACLPIAGGDGCGPPPLHRDVHHPPRL